MNETEQNTNITGDFTLDDIYFKDAFTQTEDKLNLEVDNANVSCITSKNNKFSLDEDGNLTVNSITTLLESDSQSVVDLVYPIGSIYLSVADTNPTILFGGVWTQIKDKFLLGVGDTYERDTTGGEAEHVLSVSEMPKHNHTIGFDQIWGYGGSSSIALTAGGPYYINSTSFIANAGEDKAHNNMPPYMTVYMWKRVL